MLLNFGSRPLKVSNHVDLLWALLYPNDVLNIITAPSFVTAQQFSWDKTIQETTTVAAPTGEISSDPESRTTLFALIIGINKYIAAKPLFGAVADAKSIEEYLMNTLGVPSSNITKLLDEQATRARIIEELRALSKDSRIQDGDPIFIYFAGHGGEVKASAGWSAEGDTTQYIVPVDYNCKIEGGKVKGIPDRTIAALLDDLAEAKGDNITVAFDCCHSGSGTRTDTIDPTRLVRNVEKSLPFSDDDDKAILSSPSGKRSDSIASGFLRKGLRSHVLLAACGREEVATEDDSRGIFTQALLQTLRSSGANQLTYTELIKRLPKLISQSPQCEGIHKDRMLFNNRGPSVLQVYYEVQKSEDKLEYQMKAGAAHGIAKDAKFALYKDRDSFNGPPAAILIAQTPMAFATTLIPDPEGEIDPSVSIKEGFVRQTHAGVREDLHLYIVMDERLIEVFRLLAKEMERNDDGRRHIKLVERKEDADLAVGIDSNERVIFDVRRDNGRTWRVPKTVKLLADDVYAVITAAAQFNYHLRRSTTQGAGVLLKKVDIEFLKLKQTEEFDYDRYTFVVIPDPDGKNLIVAGNVDILADESAIYGMRITSRLPRNAPELYCSVFFFDSDFSIVSYYQPGTSGEKVDTSLKPNGEGAVTIGFGAGGVSPRTYHLRPEQNFDVGFVKVFLSTEPLDLSHVCQNSPFEGRRQERPADPKRPLLWDTAIIAINQWKSREAAAFTRNQ